MPYKEYIELAVNCGLGVVLAIGMAVFMGRVLMYVFKVNEEREKDYRELIRTNLAATTKAIEAHDDRTAKAILTLEEAHRRQREEHDAHRKLLESIEDENGRRREAQVSIISALTQINSALAAINANTSACLKGVAHASTRD